jgi:hypothetical protein
MAHFAEIDNTGTVVMVHVVADEDCLDANGKESDSIGETFMQGLTGSTNKFVRTSFNTFRNTHRMGGTPFRKNFAGRGMIYDVNRDVFHEKQPYPSWSFDEETASWTPPVPMPEDEQLYFWNEDEQNWTLT